MEIKQLTAFVAVYEERSMSQAALRLDIAQPNVSNLIRNLERSLSVTLFKREATGTYPTLDAQALYPHAQRLLVQVDAARKSVNKGGITGIVRVGVAPSVAEGILPRCIRHFVERYPYVDLRITEAVSPDLMRWTVNGDLDFSIVIGSPEDRRLISRRASSEPVLLVSGRHSGRSQLTSVNLAIEEPLKLILPFGRHEVRGPLPRFIATGLIPVRQSLMMDSMSTTLDLVETSDWVTILTPSAIIRRMDQFIFQPIVNPDFLIDYFSIRHAQNTMTPAGTKFSEMIDGAFAEAASEWKKLTLMKQSI
jgi:DNA-binding transcriptional LysR family regulator